jgi:hypothetical protein
MGFDIGGVLKGAFEGFKEGGIGGLFRGAASAVMESGVLDGLLGGVSEKAEDFFENNPIGKIIGRVAPELAEGVKSLLNPANLAGLFGGAKSPGDFLGALGGVGRFIGGLFG